MRPRNAYCSFCRKSYRDVGPLVEAPDNVYICAACIELCQSIIDQEKRRRQRSEGMLPPLPPPENIEALLHFYLREPRINTRAIAAAVHSHGEGLRTTPRPQGNKKVLLLVGTSWSKALLLARVLAHILDAPFASGQAKELASTGSPTEPLALVFYRLVQAGDFDVETAQRGVVFLDGIDLPYAQEMLVNVLEEQGIVAVVPGLQIDLASILFVCRSTFVGLDEQMIRKGKHPEQPITSEDLLGLGVRPEFMRHIGAIIRISPLDEETLVRLVVSANLNNWPKAGDI